MSEEVGARGVPGAARSALSSGYRWSANFRPVLIVVLALFLVLMFTEPNFRSGNNLTNLLAGVSVLFVVSLGQTFVVLSGGIDLSVGAVAALAGIFLAKVVGTGLPIWMAIPLTVVVSAAIGGLINGLLIGRLNLSFFVVTLASASALTGIVNLWSGTNSFYVTSSVIDRIGFGSVARVPTTIWIIVVFLTLAIFVQSRTYAGRDVFAVGGSPQAARLSGIRTSRTIVGVYAACAGCAGFSAIISVGRIGAASPQVDPTLALQSAAAVLLGGTQLKGGIGGVVGTAIGVVFIGLLQNGLSIAGIPSFWQQIATGVILILAVAGGGAANSHGSLARLVASRARKSIA